MNKIKLFLFISVISFFCIISCNSEADKTLTTKEDSVEVKTDDIKKNETEVNKKDSLKTEKLGKEYTAKYICPDHCKDSGSDKEGECPNCGMEYIENPNFTK